MDTPLLLLASSDTRLCRRLDRWLRSAGYDVVKPITNGHTPVPAGTVSPDARRPDAILVDLDGDAGDTPLALLSGLRRASTVPIVALLKTHEETGLVAAMDAGADDFLLKPVERPELLARLQAVISKSSARWAQPGAVSTKDFSIDLQARRVTTSEGDVRLTPIQWRMVELLVRNPGRLITQRQLLADVWGSERLTNTNYLRVFMAAIRRKLEPDPRHPRYFHTEPGLGIRFDPGTLT
jgi:two-component system KDP operon response regulator KdpE